MKGLGGHARIILDTQLFLEFDVQKQSPIHLELSIRESKAYLPHDQVDNMHSLAYMRHTACIHSDAMHLVYYKLHETHHPLSCVVRSTYIMGIGVISYLCLARQDTS